MGAAEYVEHLDVLARWSRRIAQATGTFDVIVSPTMAVLPPSLGTISAADFDRVVRPEHMIAPE